MDDNIPTSGFNNGGKNRQGQPVPAFPDNCDAVTPSDAAFFDGPVTIYCPAAAILQVIPEGKRKEINELLALYAQLEGDPASQLADLDNYEQTAGYTDLLRTVTVAAGGYSPFRVCMVLSSVDSEDADVEVFAVY